MRQFLESAWLLVTFSALSSSMGTILLKQSRLAAIDSSFLTSIASPLFIHALIFYSTGLLLYARALDSLPISAVVPVSQGVGFILVTLLSCWFFREKITFDWVFATSLILGGIVVLTR
jgi:multidrug transporter EmrE-like cation transporter